MLRIVLAALTSLALAAGCSNSGEIQTEKTQQDENLPPAQVDLPEPPPASAYEVPERNPDGTLRIEGLIHHREKYLDQQVEVKGTIVKLSEKCDPKKAKREGTECPEPNLFIRDDAEAESALRVVGYKDDFVKRAKLEEGQERVFKGTYQKVAQGFVATEDGLLLIDYVDDVAVLEK